MVYQPFGKYVLLLLLSAANMTDKCILTYVNLKAMYVKKMKMITRSSELWTSKDLSHIQVNDKRKSITISVNKVYKFDILKYLLIPSRTCGKNFYSGKITIILKMLQEQAMRMIKRNYIIFLSFSLQEKHSLLTTLGPAYNEQFNS